MDSELEMERSEGREVQMASDEVPKLPPAKPRTALLLVALVLAGLLLSGALTLLKRAQAERVLAKETVKNSVLTVAVIRPMAEKPDQELVLPATLQAYEESPIYARTNGYLVRWYKDIGSQVKQGELLAKIDTPEVDQELLQARATRQQVEQYERTRRRRFPRIAPKSPPFARLWYLPANMNSVFSAPSAGSDVQPAKVGRDAVAARFQIQRLRDADLAG